MVEKRTWEEFRSAGLLWFVNNILHLFGWSIVVDVEDDIIKAVYPARVKFRGFDEATCERGYRRIYKYLHDNLDVITKELDEGEGEN